jgi:L-fucose isomerase-like protein
MKILKVDEKIIKKIKPNHSVIDYFTTPSKYGRLVRFDDNTIVLAHCTLPLSMCESYKLNTHFESGIGVAIKGNIKEQEITIFKLARNLKDYYVSTGKIITNINENNLCRTQIVVKLDDDVKYFLNRPYGNHHIIVLGNHKDKIIQYMNNI